MKIELNYQTSVLTLPSAALQKLDTASDADLRVLLCIAASEELRQNFDAARLSSRLDLPASEIDLSIAFWRGAGVIKVGKGAKRSPLGEERGEKEKKDPPPAPVILGADTLPDYSGKELEKLMEERKTLSQLLCECQKLLGVFNVSESNKMIALVDYLHLSDEYILTLCSYCKSRGQGQVSRVCAKARDLSAKGVVTPEDLNAYIEEDERRHDFENYLRSLLGIGGAKLSAQQKRFFDSWAALGLSREVVSFAYEQSVDSTTTLSLQHLNKILESYKKAGVKTVEDAEEERRRHKEEQKKLYPDPQRKRGRGDGAEFKSFETEEFFALAKNRKKPDGNP